jgi:hypothetical protein
MARYGEFPRVGAAGPYVGNEPHRIWHLKVVNEAIRIECPWCFAAAGYACGPPSYGSGSSFVHKSRMDKYTKEKEQVMNKARELELRAEANAREAARIEEERQKLASRPAEPVQDSVISWKHLFKNSYNGTTYDYVAYRYGKGDGNRNWVVAGPSQQGVYRNWDELMDFIESRANEGPIWIAACWEEL